MRLKLGLTHYLVIILVVLLVGLPLYSSLNLGPDPMDLFKDYALQVGVPNLDEFNRCLENGDFEQEVQKDKNDGEIYGVGGTPSIFVNGVPGVPTYEELGRAIEDALQSSATGAVSEDDDPVRGDPEAPVTIVEFSDFACPACKDFQEVLHRILQDYEGKVKLVYRDFAFVSQHSQKAAEAAQCVYAQDPPLYWDYHDKLFEKQGEWR